MTQTGSTFKVAADDAKLIHEPAEQDAFREPLDQARRAYITAAVQQRLHQRSFRAKVMHAYSNRCALCRLRHEELLDATHIIPDGHPGGDPVVQNGLALCKLHHAAFDNRIIGIRPDYLVEVRPDVLEEEDGPMLLHGLQGLHQSRIHLPRSPAQKPDPERLAWRYEQFRATG